MIQEQVINKILQDRDASIITLNNLTTEYFSDYANEFGFIKTHLDAYQALPDIETFINQFPSFPVIDVHEPNDYLLEELMRDKNKRFIVSNYAKIRQLMLDDQVEDAISLLQKAAEQSSSFVSLQAVDLARDTSRYEAYLDKLENPDKYFVKTGFPELDNIIGGWDTNEDLVTIVARLGLGKSWVLFKCASAAAVQGKRVGIYSGEMSEDAVGYRIDTLVGHISNGALVHGGASIKNQYKNYLENLQTKIPGNIFVLTPKMINGPATVSALRAFVEKYNLDILYVDQHSLLEDDKKAKTPTEKASNISKDLKLLQTTLRIPVICVSQQNREKLEEGKNFDPSQIAQSDRIGQDASIIIFLERKDDILKLHLSKSRNTGSGEILSYKVDLNSGLFSYVAEGDKSQPVQDSDGVPYTQDDMGGSQEF